ncbi:hypothetical protein GH714_027541 [Hevea brasiliensis]|uniref:Uncharacterized protein n=1 Tax=Hevea brasiliensis TaxID=3981 RepID=A0A6A6MIL5_HEVBR|nr:hypothetical protein GH714_027541 [Hevea brasiliensis]
MGDHSTPKINSRDQLSLGTSETVITRARQNLAPHDRVTPKKPTLSCADLHHEITKNIKDISPNCSRNLLKQCRKVTKEEELVKYMSNLPSYLERGENRQEKVLNVGVLDWGRLEKWQCSQKQIPHRSSRHSLSHRSSRHSLSSTNSSFLTEGSSVDSSRGQSCSPAHQRLRRPSLQSHLMSSPVEVHSQDVKSFEESIHKCQDVKGAHTNTMNEQGKFTKTDKLFSKNCPEIKLDQSKRKDSDPETNPECGTFNWVNFEVRQNMEVKTTQDVEFMKRANKLQEQKAYAFDQDVSQKSKRVVLLMPRDLTQGSSSRLSKSTAMLYQKGAKASGSSLSEMPMDMSPAAVTSDVLHSCPLPCEIEECTEIKCGSSDAESISFLPNSSHLAPHPAKIEISPSRGRISESKKSVLTPINSNSKETFAGLDMKLSKAISEKLRSTSPFRRLGIGMGQISKSFSCEEGSSIPQISTVHRSATKSASENAMASACHGNSCGDNQNATSRARSSPLRRLLEPLLKPKAPNCRHSGEPLERHFYQQIGPASHPMDV